MNSRTNLLMSEFKPQVAIMVYKSQEDYYLESHDINEAGQIMAGKPLLQETIQSMVDVFLDERQNKTNVKGIIPENLLSFTILPGGNYKMVWYRSAEARVMHHASQLKLKTAKAWAPAIVYVSDRNSLEVFSIKNNSRPVDKTVLHKAPFFNVNDGGDVCLGSAKVKKPTEPTYENLMKYWEDLFWLSEFSHVNGSEKVKSKDLAKVWRSLLGTNKKFPVSELLPCKRTNGNITLKNIL